MAEKLYFDLDVAGVQEYNPWKHSPTYKALQLIKPDSKVLDVGCAKGHMARELNKKNCSVSGIEKDPAACQLAKNHCVKAFEADLDRLEVLPFPQGYFDYILCLDVLEHLARPDIALDKLRPYLAENGELIVSIPNIARIEHRLQLLFGQFNYAEGGGLSKGHLRLFTKKTAKALLESSGYQIKKIEPTGFGSIIKILPNLFAFQFIFIACKK